MSISERGVLREAALVDASLHGGLLPSIAMASTWRFVPLQHWLEAAGSSAVQRVVFQRMMAGHLAEALSSCGFREEAAPSLLKPDAEFPTERLGALYCSLVLFSLPWPKARSLRDGDIDKRIFHDVVLVGNSTRTPTVREMIRELFIEGNTTSPSSLTKQSCSYSSARTILTEEGPSQVQDLLLLVLFHCL